MWLITQVSGELNDNLIIMFLFSSITLNIFNQVSLFQPIPKSEREISRKFEVLKFPVSQEIYVGIPGIFFTLIRVSVVLISIIPT